MKLIQLALVIISMASLVCASAPAQTTFNEVEPNSSKAEATPVVRMQSGDMLAGTSSGADMTPGSVLVTTADTFLIKSAPRPPGIYGNYLFDLTAAHVATLRGLDQTGTPGSGGTPGTVDVTLQTTQPIVSDQLLWYGFGKEEQVYVRVQGNGGAAPYTLTLSVVPQFIRWIDGTFQPGPITISTVGLTSVDTDCVLLDANFDPVPGGTNDDEYPVASKQTRLTRTLAVGVYYLGISPSDVVSAINAPNDEGFPTGRLFDFPNAVACTGYVAASPTFTISDGTTTAAGSVDQPFAHTVRWNRFTVGDYPVTAFCYGDGSSLVCPCGAGAVGHGCPNSTNAQGALLAHGGTPSFAADDLTFFVSGVPNTSASLCFQSDDYFWNVVADGLICATGGGQIIRLGVVTNPNGSSQFPESGGNSISTLGLIPGSGATRYYQVAYRDPPTFCTSGTYNYTNAMRVVWGP